jgi:gliding motility-associated lipoprotein GldD
MHSAALRFAALLALVACQPESTPKPRGYFRIEHPEPEYRRVEPECPVAFELPQFAAIERVVGAESEDGSCWFNVVFPSMEARWHLTLASMEGRDLDQLIEDAHQLAFSHDIKAVGIGRKRFSFPDRGVYGVFFQLDGPVASPMQFYATDSTRHFLRGSLYFNHVPNPDSLAPSLERVLADSQHLLETLEWSAP